MITLHNIYKHYGLNTLLEDVSLTIEPHSTHIIHGVSGSGKTTLLNIISGHESFQSGQRRVADRIRIHYAMQYGHFFDELTMEENLCFACGDKHQTGLQTLPEALMVDHRLTAYPYELSGGERQRFNILRALLDNPDVVILDEPTSALDYTTKHSVLSTLRECTQAALIIVTHDMELTTRLNGYGYQLTHGKLLML